MTTANPSTQWRSSTGFFMAALGSAVGLGNIWRFPYLVGENGGGAFILLYLLIVLSCGWPLLMAELAIGKKSGDCLDAFRRIDARRPWRWAGWPGVLATGVILTYYPVITVWVAQHLGHYVAASITHQPTPDFASLTGPQGNSTVWLPALLLGCGAIVALGVAGGIEKACRWMMPLFLVLLAGMALYCTTLPGYAKALHFLFVPDWSALLHAKTYIVALGQALFSIGLGMGILVAFGGYLPPSKRLAPSALAIVGGDSMVAIVNSLVIFPVVFSHNINPAQGPTLAFEVLPRIFANMPGGNILAGGFFMLLFLAALTSVISLLEVPASLLASRLGWHKTTSALAASIVCIVLCFPAALGVQLTPTTSVLDAADFTASSILLPLSTLCVLVMAGWIWTRDSAIASIGAKRALEGSLWYYTIRYVTPLLMMIILLTGLS